MKPIALAILATTLALASARAADPLTAAVLDFQVTGDALAGKGAEAAILLNANLSASPSLILVERQELEKLLGEQELGLSGTVDAGTAAKVGALTGAKLLVTGRLFEAGGKYFLVAKIMSTETSRVYGETATFTDLAAMDKAVAELAPKIDALVEKRGDTLVAKIEAPEARMDRLRNIIQGKALPSVSVSVAEEHLNRRAVDPAVETELQSKLAQLGFEIIDPQGKKLPDIWIGGEAFSEFAARRGNLVSCRARVEVKVTARKTGKLLLADRQTAVAVDLAENVAAKQALANAADTLLDRIVPVLVK